MLRNKLDLDLDLDRARHDNRQWVQDLRVRTRHLIELGGLVQKAGLVELMDDDRATMLGALLDIAAQLQQPDNGRSQDQDVSRTDRLTRWKRRGMRAFEAAAEPTTS